MSTLWEWVLSYCKNDVIKAERVINKLRYKALGLEEGSDSDDSDYEEESDIESESESEDELEEEQISTIIDKEGFYKLE